MGLDVVELIMAVEDTFGIELPDEDAQDVITVGDLHDLVMRKLEGVTSEGSEPRCHSSHVFYRVRRALRDYAQIPRRDITPQSDVHRLFVATGAESPEHRREVWNQFGNALGLCVPALQLPGGAGADTAVVLASATVSMAAVWAVAWSAGLSEWPVILTFLLSVGFAASVFVAIGAYRLTRRFADRIPPHCETVAGLVRDIAQMNSARLIRELGTTPQNVWERLREIVALEIAIPIERVTREARFREDLRLG